MTPKAKTRRPLITDELVEEIRGKLAAGSRVRCLLPEWGVLSVERSLPFLLVYRRPVQAADPGTDQLVASEAAFLTASSARRHQPGIARLVETVVEHGSEQFGAFLLIEVWASPAADDDEGPEAAQLERRPRFRILFPKRDDPGELLDTFEGSLAGIRSRRLRAEVGTAAVVRCAPRRLSELIAPARARELHCTVLGLEVLPVYRSVDPQETYPLVLRTLKRSLSRGLRRTIYHFARTRTTHRPEHFHVLGRRAIVKAMWEVDGRLAHVADSYDFLLQVTPANARAAWLEFQRSRFEREPTWHYRQVPHDPPVLKRSLYRIPIERVEDPALSLLFRQKQQELDREITMLADRNTPRFLPGSEALYGPIEDELVQTARRVLERLPARTREAAGKERVDARGFAARAEEEIAHYRSQGGDVDSGVEVREDLGSGLMVSRGRLLVGAETNVPASRVEALLQHEVGTHVLTYFNGQAQPFQQLRLGFAGYEALQEGLAVFAEYLVGGLSRPRVRLLAGRVIAARGLLDGASFVDTWRSLTREYGFERRTAFTVAMRIHRGGGLTKDALYLKGLVEVLAYLSRGGRLRPLLVGKFATEHVPIIRELTWRGVLREPPLTPRYLDLPGVASRLESAREGLDILELIERTRT